MNTETQTPPAVVLSTALLERQADTYSKYDTVDSLTDAQLDLIVRTRNDHFLCWVGERSIFDVERLRLMLEMGAVEAARRLELLRSNAEVSR